MTPEEIRRTITEILDMHDQALAAIRGANEAMQRGNVALQQAVSENSVALRQHDDAIVSAIAANRAALRLLNRMNEESQG